MNEPQEPHPKPLHIVEVDLEAERSLRCGERAWVAYKVPEGHTTLWLLHGATNLSQINFRQRPEHGTGFDPGGYVLDPERDQAWLVHEMGVGGISTMRLHKPQLFANLNFGAGVLATEFMEFAMLVEYVGRYSVPNKFKCRLATSTETPKQTLPPGWPSN